VIAAQSAGEKNADVTRTAALPNVSKVCNRNPGPHKEPHRRIVIGAHDLRLRNWLLDRAITADPFPACNANFRRETEGNAANIPRGSVRLVSAMGSLSSGYIRNGRGRFLFQSGPQAVGSRPKCPSTCPVWRSPAERGPFIVLEPCARKAPWIRPIDRTAALANVSVFFIVVSLPVFICGLFGLPHSRLPQRIWQMSTATSQCSNETRSV